MRRMLMVKNVDRSNVVPLLRMILCTVMAAACSVSDSKSQQAPAPDNCITCHCLTDTLNDFQNTDFSKSTACLFDGKTQARIFDWAKEEGSNFRNCSHVTSALERHLRSSFNSNACGSVRQHRSEAQNRLIARCNEDQRMTPIASPRFRDSVLQLNDDENSCRSIQSYANSAVLLIRADNEAYLDKNFEKITTDLYLGNDDELTKTIQLVALHADYNPKLRNKILRVFRSLIDEKVISPDLYIALFDRSALFNNTKQTYCWNTKCIENEAVFFPPLADIKAASKKRAEIGAPTVEEFLKAVTLSKCTP